MIEKNGGCVSIDKLGLLPRPRGGAKGKVLPLLKARPDLFTTYDHAPNAVQVTLVVQDDTLSLDQHTESIVSVGGGRVGRVGKEVERPKEKATPQQSMHDPPP